MRSVPVWIGYDPGQHLGALVTRESMFHHSRVVALEAHFLDLREAMALGRYKRPTRFSAEGDLWDEIDQSTMSTPFAYLRFGVPALARERAGAFQSPSPWAVFVDGDFLFRGDLGSLVATLNPAYSVYCYQRPPPAHTPSRKMGGRPNRPYPRKLWSSLMIWNLDHPDTATLTWDAVNTWSGSALHQLQWTEQIGPLPAAWNHVPGLDEYDEGAQAVHYSLGGPWLRTPGPDSPYNAEWWEALGEILARTGERCLQVR